VEMDEDGAASWTEHSEEGAVIKKRIIVTSED